MANEDGSWIIFAGYHFADRLGYFITEKPWTTKDMEIHYA